MYLILIIKFPLDNLFRRWRSLFPGTNGLTHWGRVTHICVRKLTTFGTDNGLSPGRRQAIIWTNAVILSIWSLATNFNEILIKIQTFPFKKMHLKLSSGKWRPFCLGLSVLICGCHHQLMGRVRTVTMGMDVKQGISQGGNLYQMTKNACSVTENSELWWCYICSHWWHLRLSVWQPVVSQVKKSRHHDDSQDLVVGWISSPVSQSTSQPISQSVSQSVSHFIWPNTTLQMSVLHIDRI